MGTPSRLSGSAALAFLCGCSTPDLTFSELKVSPATAAPGERIAIAATLENAGGGVVPAVLDEREPPPIVDFTLRRYRSEEFPAHLGEWFSLPYPLEGGQAYAGLKGALTPSAMAAGDYLLCAEADRERLLEESNERNNERCTPFVVTARATQRPDLVIDSIERLGLDKASDKVRITVRNVGEADSPPVEIGGWRVSPRTRVFVTRCAMTFDERRQNRIPACGVSGTGATLQPGATATVDAWVTMPSGPGGAFEWNDLSAPPPDDQTGATPVEFMVDACSGGSQWCAVDEIDERNNFRTRTIRFRK